MSWPHFVVFGTVRRVVRLNCGGAEYAVERRCVDGCVVVAMALLLQRELVGGRECGKRRVGCIRLKMIWAYMLVGEHDWISFVLWSF